MRGRRGNRGSESAAGGASGGAGGSRAGVVERSGPAFTDLEDVINCARHTGSPARLFKGASTRTNPAAL